MYGGGFLTHDLIPANYIISFLNWVALEVKLSQLEFIAIVLVLFLAIIIISDSAELKPEWLILCLDDICLLVL